MMECDIKGCGEMVSELLSPPEEVKRWFVATPETWPNLDWAVYGGVTKITLCPHHKGCVAEAIMMERTLDPSMNAERPDPGNVH